jgi:protein-S-isoprenylcysteine O-methyltransferase Ste14
VRWGGALLFGAALGYFGYRFVVSFGAPAPAPADVASVLWNVTLFTAFALHHSLFARTPVRAWIARTAPRHERSIYVWVASLLFIAVCGLWQPVGGVAWEADGWLRWVLRGVQAAGVVLTLRGAAVLDPRELAGITQGDEGLGKGAGPSAFKTEGPYGWVRHPIYLGWFLMVLAASPMTMTRLVFAAVSCFYLVVAIPFEESTLRRTSAGAYDAYSRQVRWKLLPGLY